MVGHGWGMVWAWLGHGWGKRHGWVKVGARLRHGVCKVATISCENIFLDYEIIPITINESMLRS